MDPRQRYLRDHPEAKMLMTCFIQEVIYNQPKDIRTFAEVFFKMPETQQFVAQQLGFETPEAHVRSIISSELKQQVHTNDAISTTKEQALAMADLIQRSSKQRSGQTGVLENADSHGQNIDNPHLMTKLAQMRQQRMENVDSELLEAPQLFNIVTNQQNIVNTFDVDSNVGQGASLGMEFQTIGPEEEVRLKDQGYSQETIDQAKKLLIRDPTSTVIHPELQLSELEQLSVLKQRQLQLCEFARQALNAQKLRDVGTCLVIAPKFSEQLADIKGCTIFHIVGAMLKRQLTVMQSNALDYEVAFQEGSLAKMRIVEPNILGVGAYEYGFGIRRLSGFLNNSVLVATNVKSVVDFSVKSEFIQFPHTGRTMRFVIGRYNKTQFTNLWKFFPILHKGNFKNGPVTDMLTILVSFVPVKYVQETYKLPFEEYQKQQDFAKHCDEISKLLKQWADYSKQLKENERKAKELSENEQNGKLSPNRVSMKQVDGIPDLDYANLVKVLIEKNVKLPNNIPLQDLNYDYYSEIAQQAVQMVQEIEPKLEFQKQNVRIINLSSQEPAQFGEDVRYQSFGQYEIDNNQYDNLLDHFNFQNIINVLDNSDGEGYQTVKNQLLLEFLKNVKGDYMGFLKKETDRLNLPTKEVPLLHYNLDKVVLTLLSLKNMELDSFQYIKPLKFDNGIIQYKQYLEPVEIFFQTVFLNKSALDDYKENPRFISLVNSVVNRYLGMITPSSVQHYMVVQLQANLQKLSQTKLGELIIVKEETRLPQVVFASSQYSLFGRSIFTEPMDIYHNIDDDYYSQILDRQFLKQQVLTQTYKVPQIFQANLSVVFPQLLGLQMKIRYSVIRISSLKKALHEFYLNLSNSSTFVHYVNEQIVAVSGFGFYFSQEYAKCFLFNLSEFSRDVLKYFQFVNTDGICTANMLENYKFMMNTVALLEIAQRWRISDNELKQKVVFVTDERTEKSQNGFGICLKNISDYMFRDLNADDDRPLTMQMLFDCRSGVLERQQYVPGTLFDQNEFLSKFGLGAIII